MFCVGLTGNIGSGKTTAISFFKSLGADVIIADIIARDLTAIDQPAFKEIVTHFGYGILNDEGQLNRVHLRTLISKDEKERLWLEQLLHPLIQKTIKLSADKCSGPYCIIEIPLLINRLTYPYLDRILVILSNSETQINRIISRDSCSQEQALAMLALQPNEKDRRALADDIIINNNSLNDLQKKIIKLHTKYLQLAYEKSL